MRFQEESADMARRSVRHNKLEDQIEIVTGDIKEAGKLFDNASFDVITTNPPYMIGEHGLKMKKKRCILRDMRHYARWMIF